MFNKRNNTISELEAEIKSLRRKLRNAEAAIVERETQILEQKAQITEQIHKIKLLKEETRLALASAVDNSNEIASRTNVECQSRCNEQEDVSQQAVIEIKVCRAGDEEHSCYDGKSLVNTNGEASVKRLSTSDETEVERQAREILDKHGEDWLVWHWIELGGMTSSAPSVDEYIAKLNKTAKFNKHIDPTRFKNDKAVGYLLEKVFPSLPISHEVIKIHERQRSENERLNADWRLYKNELEVVLKQHSVPFMRNMRLAYQKDEYGAVVKDEREAEIERFLRSVNLIQRANKHSLKKTIQHVNRWYAKKKRAFEQSDVVPDNGHDFEHWVAAKLDEAGWKATVTQASGDDGVDVIAERDGFSVAVQCKRFKGSVGNKAVQEVYSGMKHMQLDKAVVISTGKYTKSAQNIASTTGVLLLSEHDIPHLWDLLQK